MPEHPSARILPPIALALANLFYRSHRSRMRARGHHRVLVLQDAVIRGALCLQSVADGTWLTNLLIDPQCRNQGCGLHLLSEARRHVVGPIWLFCHPDLEPFYQRAGYLPSGSLPHDLQARLVRYRRHKPLIALVNPA